MKKYDPVTNPSQKDMIDDMCDWLDKDKTLEQLELLSIKNDVTEEELNAFNHECDSVLQPFIDKVKRLFEPFGIDVDFEEMIRGEFGITIMIPAPFPIEIEFCYDFNESLEKNVETFEVDFKLYCDIFNEANDILTKIKGTF